jgi:hypothetical protein
MQTKFKKHDRVILLVDPDSEYIEYEPDFEDIPIKKGMLAEVNMILPNGKYHVRVLDKKGNILAYVPMDEEQLGVAAE